MNMLNEDMARLPATSSKVSHCTSPCGAITATQSSGIYTIIDAMYVAMTEITKQTVYTGPVVFWTAIFLGVATILIPTNIGALFCAKANHSSGYQTARNLFFAAAFVSLTIFAVACIYIEMQLKQS
jgi:hypothetical protein